MMNCEDTGGIQLKVINLKIKKDGSRELLVGNTPKTAINVPKDKGAKSQRYRGRPATDERRFQEFH